MTNFMNNESLDTYIIKWCIVIVVFGIQSDITIHGPKCTYIFRHKFEPDLGSASLYKVNGCAPLIAHFCNRIQKVIHLGIMFHEIFLHLAFHFGNTPSINLFWIQFIQNDNGLLLSHLY